MTKKRYVIILILSVTLFLISAVYRPVAAGTLSVKMHPQETRYWCWAASAQMIMDYHGKNISQCKQVNDYLDRKDCCRKPTPSDPCIIENWPDFERYGFTCDTTYHEPLSWEEIKRQIDVLKTPFCCTWEWSGGGGHMVVVVGYKVMPDGTKKVIINDPNPPNQGRQYELSYESYCSGNNYTHWNDYYNIKKEK